MPAFKEIWYSNPVDEFFYITLTFEHSVFDEPHRLVINHDESVMLGVDESSPDVFEFVPVQGRVVRPEINTTGRQQFSFELDGVSLQISEQMDDVLDVAPEPVYVTLSEYIASEPEAPKLSLRAVLVDPQITETRFSATGAFSDVVNKAFSSKVYTTVSNPGLA